MEITYCPNCGHQNQPGSRFCEECGCDLIQAAAQQEADGTANAATETSAGATGSTGTAKSTGSQTEYGSTNIFQ